MPRASRKIGISGIYHVVIRGINKELLFLDDCDDRYFLSILSKYKKQCGFKLLAYCLMSNHAHLLVRVGEEQLGDFMKKILISYSHFFNKKYDRTGHVFQNRYFSEPVDSEAYLIRVLQYIFNNPVRSGIVRKPDDYQWSSHSELFREGRGITDSADIFALLSDDKAILYPILQKDISSDEKDPIVLPRTVLTDSEVCRLAEELSGCRTVSDYRDLSKEDRAKCVLALRTRGITVRQISRVTGISKSVIGSIR